MDDTTEIEIAAPSDAGDDEPSGAYRGMLVPLVVVPAMIVMVVVIVMALFGLLSGSESTPGDNLDTLLVGGVNEREQAAFELVRQVLEYQNARKDGREPEWDIDESMLERMRVARAGLPQPRTAGEVWIPFVLASISAQLGDTEAVDELVAFTHLDDALDPEIKVRSNAIFVLGSIGKELPEAVRQRVAAALIELLEGEDAGIAWLSAGALQNLESPGTAPALVAVLGSRRLDMRIQAALSLCELGHDGGFEVLLEGTDMAPYVAEREADPRKWAPEIVSLTRQKVLRGFDTLDRRPERAVLQALVDDDQDPNVQAVALELLSRLP